MDRRDTLGLLGVLSIMTAVALWVDPYYILEKAGLFVTKYSLIAINSIQGIYLLMLEKKVDSN